MQSWAGPSLLLRLRRDCCFSLSQLLVVVTLKHSCEQHWCPASFIPMVQCWCGHCYLCGYSQLLDGNPEILFSGNSDGCHHSLYPKGHSKRKLIYLLTPCARWTAFAPTYPSACNCCSNCSYSCELSWISPACRRSCCWKCPSGIPDLTLGFL